MIKDIEISNFRCFEHTKIEGFERVNLIGGKNNSGKPVLLEALIVCCWQAWKYFIFKILENRANKN